MFFAFFIKILPEQTNASLFANAKTLVLFMLLNVGLRPAMPTIAAIVKSVFTSARLARSSSPLKHFTLLPLNSFLAIYNIYYQILLHI